MTDEFKVGDFVEVMPLPPMSPKESKRTWGRILDVDRTRQYAYPYRVKMSALVARYYPPERLRLMDPLEIVVHASQLLSFLRPEEV